jgi:CBS domain containing-hemolysin-like protein
VLATPEDRRPWVAISTVARQVSPGMILPAELEGEELIRSMQQMPATEYLLVEEDGSVYGVLVAEDVDRAFAQQRNR